MSWFDILKISTEDAISDVERFAPEMIVEQKKLDEEERQRAEEIAMQEYIAQNIIPKEQLPRIDEFYPSATRTTGQRARGTALSRYEGRRHRIAGTQTVNWKAFILTDLPYFLTVDELKEYRKKKLTLAKIHKLWFGGTDWTSGTKILEEWPDNLPKMYELPTSENESTEYLTLINDVSTLSGKAMARWQYYFIEERESI